jgi:hypothetical protein
MNRFTTRMIIPSKRQIRRRRNSNQSWPPSWCPSSSLLLAPSTRQGKSHARQDSTHSGEAGGSNTLHRGPAALRETILAQTNWTPAMFNWVNWTSLGRAFRQVARHLRATMAKLQHNLLATAVHLHSHGNKKIDKRCFRCHNLREDFDHILWCPQGSLARPALWDNFIAVVDSLQTAQYIKHKLLFGISQWQHQGKDSAWPADIPPYTDTVGRLTHIAYFEQEQLGWEQALCGRLSKR